MAEEPGTGLAGLLRPERQVVAFAGRGDELRVLRAWCESDEARSARVIVGGSGVGKTRLALQIAAEWEAGGALWRPVLADDGGAAVASARAVSSGRLLLVLDHAETSNGLADLLDAVLADPGPVRLLLIAESLGEWWTRLTGPQQPYAGLLTEEPPLRLLPPLSSTATDAEVAAHAVPYLARALSLKDPGPVQVERSALRMPVLLLHTAALLALMRSVTTPGTPVRVVLDMGVLGELLRREVRYWRRAAAVAGLPDDESLIGQVVAATTLTGVRSIGEAQSVLARLPGLSGEAQEQRALWAQWLAVLYPAAPDGRLGGLEPDMLAEAHVTDLLARDEVLARALLRNLPPHQAEHALTLLARASAYGSRAPEIIAAALHYDLPHLARPAAHVAIQGHPGLADLLCEALCTAPAAPEELAQIALDLPYPSLVVAEATLIATLRTRESMPIDADLQPGAEWDQRAARLLDVLGWPQVSGSQELVPYAGAARGERRRRMTSQDQRRSLLAPSLTNLAVRFSSAGRPADALRAERAAIGLYRELMPTDPDRYRPELASCLTNLGVWLAALGRPDEAVVPTEEAAATFREITASGMTRHLADLATAVTNLGIWHAEQGHSAEALRAEEEAVTIFRRLAAADPGQYRADLATSLTNLGIWFSRDGRPEEAARAEEEAVALRRELSAADPGRYRADLATSLTNLGITYGELGRPNDALVPAKEVVITFRELAAIDPDRYRPELARALANLGIRYTELGRPGAAVAPAKEAVAIRRRLAEADPGRHQISLARSLEGLSETLEALGQHDDAATVREEAEGMTTGPDELPAATETNEPTASAQPGADALA
jgi:tetratricopeptide (TPR) repeat protein